MKQQTKGVDLSELVAVLHKESENDFLSWVLDYAHLRGWLVHHTRPAWSAKGYRTPLQGDTGAPDCLLARNGRVILAELKSEKGKVSPEQQTWIDELNGEFPLCKIAFVWRPSMRGEIMEILK